MAPSADSESFPTLLLGQQQQTGDNHNLPVSKSVVNASVLHGKLDLRLVRKIPLS
jgi:hypothetical protein